MVLLRWKKTNIIEIAYTFLMDVSFADLFWDDPFQLLFIYH